jgi:hypothetical protein
VFSREISGFRSGAIEAFALLECYVACVHSRLPTVLDYLWGLSSLGPDRLSRNVGKPLCVFIFYVCTLYKYCVHNLYCSNLISNAMR